MSNLVRLSFSIESQLASQFERLVAKGDYGNRSEFFRDLVRDKLVAEQWSSTGEALATITLVYDHHKPKLNDKLLDIQHDYQDLILVSTHVHLDHDHCAEAIMLRGDAKRIRLLADRLKQLKGVLHAALSMSSLGTGLA
jgi:CopG family nickel-responsive transcriptional regulator